MTTHQLLLELLNSSLVLQSKMQSTLEEVVAINKDTTWEIWFKYHIPNMLQLIAIGVGVWVVKHQINKQQESVIYAQNETIKTNLRLQLRSDFEKIIDSLNSMTAVAGNFPLNLAMSILIARNNQITDRTVYIIPQRVPKFNSDNADIHNGIVEIIKLIEKYEIVMPQLKIFQTAMNVAATDLRDATGRYFDSLLNFLPFDLPEHEAQRAGFAVRNRPLPSLEQEVALKELGKRYSDALGILSCWIMDLRIELQNLALGNLYPNNFVPPRQPIDPIYKVIKTDPETILALTEYFENDTVWGANKRQAEENARNALLQTPLNTN